MSISSEDAKHRSMVAYFCMEVGLDPAMPTYAGGLGMLAGDTLSAAADLGVPMVGLTLLHRKGYFRQHLDNEGQQTESPARWSPEKLLEPMPERVSVTIEGRPVYIRAWLYKLTGISGHVVPVYFLDTALPENTSWDQTLTDYLYGGDEHYRLCQEVILGLGGAVMLSALGYGKIQVYHMNEGHSALLTLALARDLSGESSLRDLSPVTKDAVRRRCVFTTHTPVPAGHDRFPISLVSQVLGDELTSALQSCKCLLDGVLNMTYLAFSFSHYVNGVSMHHEEIAHSMFPNYPINSITNGVHAVNWTAPALKEVYDRHIPEWRWDNLYLRYAVSIALEEIRQAHQHAKQGLIAEVKKRTGQRLDPEILTIGFARRATAYKRADLLFSDLDRLTRIAREAGPVQVIYGGKAHPQDDGGKHLIRSIFGAAAALGDTLKVVYLEEYDMSLAKYVCSGVDLWLNTPQRPFEASGTSGMKAALNGVPSLSILDGWWIEGNVEGVTGWSIGDSWEPESDPAKDVSYLYDKLEHVILPMFYQKPDDYCRVMRWAIALNGSYYNAQRMLLQYLNNAYEATASTVWAPKYPHEYDHG
jgi:starch phosphorylase